MSAVSNDSKIWMNGKLVAKENVISTFAMLGAVVSVIPGVSGVESTFEGASDVAMMIQATGISTAGIISFVAFNMLTIPCFAAVATARVELKPGTLKWTILFWIVTSYIVSSMIYTVGDYWWSVFIWIVVITLIVVGIYLFNKYKDQKRLTLKK